VLASAGHALLEAGQYSPARELLEQAVAASPAGSGEVPLDLARAAFYASGSAEGMQLLDRVPDSGRGWDFYLARAEMLDAAGNAPEAAAALAQALRVSPGQSRPYVQACIFLLRKGRTEDTVRISGDAVRAFAQDREVLLVRAAALELSGSAAEAQSILEQIQNRWPEWAAAWAAEGILSGMHGRRGQAIASLRTAVALGAGKEIKNYLDQLSAGPQARPPDLIPVLTRSLRSW
jgi:hypothetical protein